jgi:hypothetical protein
MIDLNNIEGIGMDRVEETKVKIKPIVKAKPALSEFELKVCAMSLTFNTNQIASMLRIHKHEVEAILSK